LFIQSYALYLERKKEKMNFLERKNIILQQVTQRGSVHATELMRLTGASEITVRRDLTQLEQRGLLTRSHGGAMRTDLAKDPDIISFAGKASRQNEEKTYIARLASGELHDGDVVFMDCGSTVFGLCDFIMAKKLKIITNSLPIAQKLMLSSCTVTLIGGELDAKRQAIHGRTATKQIQSYRANKALIGCDGLSLKQGLSAMSENEAEVSLTMAEQAEHCLLLADASKFEKDSFRNFAPWTLVHKLITDRSLDYDIYKKYQTAGINIMK
jgi:DeoR family transcriptional regulator, fructose operon transcriptional repressor